MERRSPVSLLRLRQGSWIAAVAIVALVTSVTVAGAFNLRSPQVAVGGSSLQNYLNGVGESITVGTDQLDAQTWTTSVSGNATFTLMIELAGNAASNAIGVYNGSAGSPTLYQIFPGAATAGWYATAAFRSNGNLTVSLFDNNDVYQGQTGYTGVDRTNFGFYLQGPGGTFYSQDYRNAGYAYVLTYAGTGVNFGDWWQCFEDLPSSTTDWDFEDAILLIQSVVPTPASTQSWGGLKRIYGK
jgi:hypothetical protein